MTRKLSETLRGNFGSIPAGWFHAMNARMRRRNWLLTWVVAIVVTLLMQDGPKPAFNWIEIEGQ